jgi:hypothetical protein
VIVIITNDMHSSLAFREWLRSKTRYEKQKFPNNWTSPKQWFSIFNAFLCRNFVMGAAPLPPPTPIPLFEYAFWLQGMFELLNSFDATIN